MELFTVRSVWHWLCKGLRQGFTKAPRIMKRVQIDKLFVVSGMHNPPLDLRYWLTILWAGFINFVFAFPTFAIMLNIDDKWDALVNGNKKNIMRVYATHRGLYHLVPLIGVSMHCWHPVPAVSGFQYIEYFHDNIHQEKPLWVLNVHLHSLMYNIS